MKTFATDHANCADQQKIGTRVLCAKVAKLAIFSGKCISHKNRTGHSGQKSGKKRNLGNPDDGLYQRVKMTNFKELILKLFGSVD